MSPDRNHWLVTASWVYSDKGWIEGGAVLLDADKGLAIDAGKPEELEASWGIPSSRIKHYPQCLLLPAMVNGHTHLELSAHPMIKSNGYFSWVRRLLQARSQIPPDQILEAFKKSLKQAREEGTCLLGDVTNIPILTQDGDDRWPRRHVFWELLGFNVGDIYDALTESQRLYFLDGKFTRHISLVPHALYSTSARLISQTYRWCRSRGRPFAIHIGEHTDELEFLLTGQGACRELLEELGRWNPVWKAPGVRPVKYLDELGVLDERTLLVHCVHFNDDDWQIVKVRGCHVCFCPRSNEFLGVGRPNIGRAYELGIPVLIGTDSPASSPDLNMFREIKFVIDSYPGLLPDQVLKSATFTGFRFFAGNTHMPYLLVPCEGSPAKDTLTERAIEKGSKGEIKWLEEDSVSEE